MQLRVSQNPLIIHSPDTFFPMLKSLGPQRGRPRLYNTDDPPQLNWIYVDKDTLEIKYGIRADSQDHLVGLRDKVPTRRFEWHRDLCEHRKLMPIYNPNKALFSKRLPRSRCLAQEPTPRNLCPLKFNVMCKSKPSPWLINS